MKQLIDVIKTALTDKGYQVFMLGAFSVMILEFIWLLLAILILKALR